MPTWRCPHCGTPQTETARCWVCRRSSTACGTCRHFRRSVAKNVGYCGLDRRRAPLIGDEIRECWTAKPSSAVPVTDVASADPAGPGSMAAVVPRSEARTVDGAVAATPAGMRPAARLDFVEVGTGPIEAAVTTPAPSPPTFRTRPRPSVQAAPPDAPVDPVASPPSEPRWSLWGDLDG